MRGGDSYPPVGPDLGLAGVLQKIDKDLQELRPIARQGWEVGGHGYLNATLRLMVFVAKPAESLFDQVGYGHAFLFVIAHRLSETFKSRDDAGDSIRSGQRFLDNVGQFLLSIVKLPCRHETVIRRAGAEAIDQAFQFAMKHVEVQGHDAIGIVDLVRNARRQCSQRRQSLRMHGFGTPPVRFTRGSFHRPDGGLDGVGQVSDLIVMHLCQTWPRTAAGRRQGQAALQRLDGVGDAAQHPSVQQASRKQPQSRAENQRPSCQIQEAQRDLRIGRAGNRQIQNEPAAAEDVGYGDAALERT